MGQRRLAEFVREARFVRASVFEGRAEAVHGDVRKDELRDWLSRIDKRLERIENAMPTKMDDEIAYIVTVRSDFQSHFGHSGKINKNKGS